MGPLPSGEYVFAVVDYFSRYFEVDILKSTTAPRIIESLDKIFCTHGLPRTLKTDNVPQYFRAVYIISGCEWGIPQDLDSFMAPGQWLGRATKYELT